MSDMPFSTQLLLERGQRILEKKSRLDVDNLSQIKDADWVKQGFFVYSPRTNKGEAVYHLEEIDRRNSALSSAYFKWIDSTPGGNLYINPKPQYTRYADPRSKCIVGNRDRVSVGAFNGNHGVGRYYSEAIDDPSQIVYMRFGVPQFNSLTQFFTGFFNVGHATAARTGRASSGFFQKVGYAVGLLVNVIYWPLLALQAVGTFYRFFFNKPSSKFYTLKPSMTLYWNAVIEIVNQIAVVKGILPTIMDKQNDTKVDQAYSFDKEALKNMHTLLPDIFTSEDGFIDVYSMAGKAQRVKDKMDKVLYDSFNEGVSSSDFTGFVKKVGQLHLNSAPGNHSFANALQRWIKGGSNQPENQETVEKAPNISADGSENLPPEPPGMNDIMNAEFNDGTAFVGFRVDYTGPVSESFSNSFTESDLAQKINSTSATAREFNFSLAGGNIAGGNAIGDAVQGVFDAAKSFVGGALEAFNASGLLALAGSAFVDIPKHWQSSMSQLPRANYTITLSSPYGNPISQMINIYIPLAMLLAAALPLSTGRQSYTSPLLCEYYDKGRSQTRLGMFESLSVSRGTGNMGFNKNDNAMSIEVSFTIADMSSVMHMPIGMGFFSGTVGVLDDQTSFTDYMNILGSAGLREQIYRWPTLARNVARTYRRAQSLVSPYKWAAVIHEKTPVGMLDAFYRGTDRS